MSVVPTDIPPPYTPYAEHPYPDPPPPPPPPTQFESRVRFALLDTLDALHDLGYLSVHPAVHDEPRLRRAALALERGAAHALGVLYVPQVTPNP
jgi:hypothetical protein